MPEDDDPPDGREPEPDEVLFDEPESRSLDVPFDDPCEPSASLRPRERRARLRALPFGRSSLEESPAEAFEEASSFDESDDFEDVDPLDRSSVRELLLRLG